MAGIQKQAQQALALRLCEVILGSSATEHLAAPALDERGYLIDPETGRGPTADDRTRYLARFLTVETVDDAALETALAHLAGGAGSELTGRPRKGQLPDPAKFAAAYSSAQLALNCFAPFLAGARPLSLLKSQLGTAQLERILSIGGRCGSPNLDLLSEDDGSVFAVESKCTEHLKTKTSAGPSDFMVLKKRDAGDPYDARVRAIGGAGAIELYGELAADAIAFKHLDATQLLKHYLGLRNEFNGLPSTLLYLYWEPVNAHELVTCLRHREETERLAPLLTDEWVTFRSMPYRELWEGWSASGDEFLVRHAAALTERYAVTLPAGR